MATELIRSTKGMTHHGVTDPYPTAEDRQPRPSVPATRSVAALTLRPAARPPVQRHLTRLGHPPGRRAPSRTAIAQPDTEMWCSVAVRPLAALLDSASPTGTGRGIGWVRNTVSAIHDAEPADPIWDDAQTACNRLAGSVQLRTALPWLRGLEPRQRHSVTLTMREAVATLR